ncbi:MAG: aminotransferase class V-fold PLP-dependent enzyme [Candidatus Schekmanbacteria bacterium]|nr:aminotransferase class V-fold PLP-dependent enzyme [Candidatus Schekmanbacteria bacterium]
MIPQNHLVERTKTQMGGAVLPGGRLQIPWWNIELGDDVTAAVVAALRDRRVSQGQLTEELEARLAELLGVPFAVCTTSGTTALLIALLAAGIGPGDEVIVPDRTYVATANAARLLGATIRLADVEADRPLLAVEELAKLINARTRAIIPVHLNGRAAAVKRIGEIAEKNGIAVIEDACQAFCSQTAGGELLGTCSRFGCFSLGMAKLLSTGQGGFVTCHSRKDADSLRRIKNQGVFDPHREQRFDTVAGNFKLTDVQAAMGLAQLSLLPARQARMRVLYEAYVVGLRSCACLREVGVRCAAGELPLRAEFLCSDRDQFIREMQQRGIQVVPQTPSLHHSAHLDARGSFPRAAVYDGHLLILPSGPDQPAENVSAAICAASEVGSALPPWPGREP